MIRVFSILRRHRSLFLALALFGLIEPGLAQAQTVYAADATDGLVIEIGSSGSVSNVFSGFPYPLGLAINSSGGVFVANYFGSPPISEISAAGNITTFSSDSNIVYADSLAFSPNGTLWAMGNNPNANYDNSSFYIVNSAGVAAPGGLVFGAGTDMAFNPSGHLYVSSEHVLNGLITSGAIYEIGPTGPTTFVTGSAIEPVALTFDPAGDLFVSNPSASQVLEYTPAGAERIFADITNPGSLAFDPVTGDLLVGSNKVGSSSILQIAPDGSVSTFVAYLPEEIDSLAVSPLPLPSPVWMAGAGVFALFIYQITSQRSRACRSV